MLISLLPVISIHQIIDLKHLLNYVKPIIYWIKITEKADFDLIIWSDMFFAV